MPLLRKQEFRAFWADKIPLTGFASDGLSRRGEASGFIRLTCYTIFYLFFIYFERLSLETVPARLYSHR